MKKKDRDTNSKVLAMYQAVVDLIEEEEISGLKVSDIAHKAGIGKGTAYEYFSSKEEIIDNALRWDIQQRIEAVEEKIKCAATMKEQILLSMDWIEHNVHRQSAGIHFLRLSRCAGEMQEKVQRGGMEALVDEKHKELLGVLDVILQKGEEEGSVAVDLPGSLKYFILISNFMGFFVMANREHALSDISLEEAKIRICDIIMNNLQ